MKSLILTFTVFVMSSVAMATQDINFLSCFYQHDMTGWHYGPAMYSLSPFNLSEDQSQIVNATWTIYQPEPPYVAMCSSMIGTKDDDAVILKSVRYEATSFDWPTGNECEFTGQDVKLVFAEKKVLRRGVVYDEFKADWASPNFDKYLFRTYFLTHDEISRFDIKEFADYKCMELFPKENQ